MNSPMVSIIFPCLNARTFLPERLESLLVQTFKNWEAIVLDSHSDDGSWEQFENVAKSDKRFKLHRVPREGLYAALNRGLLLAKGEYIHIATCDDTMLPTFLEETVNALESNINSGIAATDVEFINEFGCPLNSDRFGDGLIQSSLPNPLKQINLRPIPHDSLLHLSGNTVYLSLTQLLVKKEIATQNFFDVNCGSMADYEWSMIICSKTSTVHIPKKLSTWRFHGDQLSVYGDDTRLKTAYNACMKHSKTYSGPNHDMIRKLKIPISMLRDLDPDPKYSPSWIIANLNDLFKIISILFVQFSKNPNKLFKFILNERFTWKFRKRWAIRLILFSNNIEPIIL